MEHPTYVVTGRFSTDSTGKAVAYAYTEAATWGTLKQQGDKALVPVNDKVIASDGHGLFQEYQFARGLLESADCSTVLLASACTGDKRTLQFWKWNGTKFVLDHTAGGSKEQRAE